MATILARAESASVTGAAGAETPTVLHAHHYNLALQRALLEVPQLEPRALLERAAAETAYQQLVEELAGIGESGAKARLREVGEALRRTGLGGVELAGVTKSGGEVVVTGSHFALGWHQKFGKGKEPACPVVAGYLAGALAAAFGQSYLVCETACMAAGAPACRFAVTPSPEPVDLAAEAIFPTAAPVQIPAADRSSGVDEGAVQAALRQTPLEPGREGNIRAFGSLFTRLSPDFYMRLRQRFERGIPRALGPKFANLGSIVLTEAGHSSAYHTFGELLKSVEWTERVAPGLRSKEEWAHALVAAINLLGWGTWRIHSLVPHERLYVRIYHSAEAVAHRRCLGKAEGAKCYLARGTAAAIMNLLYVGDITSRPALTPAYYDQIFRSPLSFRAEETRCLAHESPYCELVVNPLSPRLSAFVNRK